MPPCTSSTMPPPSPSSAAPTSVADKGNHYPYQSEAAAAAAAKSKTTTTTTTETEEVVFAGSGGAQLAQTLPAPEHQQQQLEQTRSKKAAEEEARLSTSPPKSPSTDQTTTIPSPPTDQTSNTAQINNKNNLEPTQNIPTIQSIPSITAIDMNPRQSIESGDSRPSSLSSQSPSINGDSEVEMGDHNNEKKEVVDAEVQTNTEKVCSTFDLESGRPEKTTKTINQSTSENQMPRKPESRLIAYLKRASNVSPFFHKWFSAILYAVCSTLIMLINKIVLTSYGFPSFKILALGQMLATVVLLHLARATGIVTFPRFSFTVVRNIFPIPLLYAGNLLSGLGSTKRLNLPMYTVLRRVAILFTMIAEYYLLSISQTATVQATVYMMVGGAVVAAFDDLAFDLLGYLYVLLNDLFTASYSVYIKKKLDANDLSKYGLLYYNALFMLVPILAISLAVDDWYACFVTFEHWASPGFVISFTLSCVMGFVLMYATVLCTEHNSALTTAIVGCLRSILVTYLGMFIGGDYIFSAINFAGVSISVLGSLIYTYVTFIQKHIGGGKKGKDDAREKVSEEEAKEAKETEKTAEDQDQESQSQQQQVPEIKIKQ